MSPELADLILAAADAISACIEDTDSHPGRALAAVCEARSYCLGLGMYGRAPQEWYDRLCAISGGCERACSVWVCDAEQSAVVLRGELRKLEGLVRIAEAVREGLGV